MAYIEMKRAFYSVPRAKHVLHCKAFVIQDSSHDLSAAGASCHVHCIESWLPKPDSLILAYKNMPETWKQQVTSASLFWEYSAKYF